MREDMYFSKNKGRIIKLLDKEWENVRDQLVNTACEWGISIHYGQ